MDTVAHDTYTAQAAADRASITEFLRILPLARLVAVRDAKFDRWCSDGYSEHSACLIGVAVGALEQGTFKDGFLSDAELAWRPCGDREWSLYNAAYPAFDRLWDNEGATVVVPFCQEAARAEIDCRELARAEVLERGRRLIRSIEAREAVEAIR